MKDRINKLDLVKITFFCSVKDTVMKIVRIQIYSKKSQKTIRKRLHAHMFMIRSMMKTLKNPTLHKDHCNLTQRILL
jgi:hypothetical protein